MKKSSRMLSIAAAFLLVMLAVFGVLIAVNYTQTPASPVAKTIVFEVTPSMSFATVAQELSRLGVLTSPKMFNLYAKIKGQRGQLKVGEYELNTKMVPGEVLAIIISGKSRSRPFVIPEGYNIFETADQFEKEGFGKRAEFLALAEDQNLIKSLLGQEYTSLEGYLFPETYLITKFMTTKDIISAMVRRFQVVYSEIGSQNSLRAWTPHQIVTLASIIEKETGAAQERRIISSVFHNRLLKKMRLQTDPTIIYGIARMTGKIPNNIHKSDLLKPTPYNTYVIAGLPPGPISNPGRESLLAAMNPERSEFLYFVSQNSGTHVFSKTYQEHEAAVRKFQLDRRAREGKSWRDLEKSNETQKN